MGHEEDVAESAHLQSHLPVAALDDVGLHKLPGSSQDRTVGFKGDPLFMLLFSWKTMLSVHLEEKGLQVSQSIERDRVVAILGVFGRIVPRLYSCKGLKAQ